MNAVLGINLISFVFLQAQGIFICYNALFETISDNGYIYDIAKDCKSL